MCPYVVLRCSIKQVGTSDLYTAQLPLSSNLLKSPQTDTTFRRPASTEEYGQTDRQTQSGECTPRPNHPPCQQSMAQTSVCAGRAGRAQRAARVVGVGWVGQTEEPLCTLYMYIHTYIHTHVLYRCLDMYRHKWFAGSVTERGFDFRMYVRTYKTSLVDRHAVLCRLCTEYLRIAERSTQPEYTTIVERYLHTYICTYLLTPDVRPSACLSAAAHNRRPAARHREGPPWLPRIPQGSALPCHEVRRVGVLMLAGDLDGEIMGEDG